MAARTKSLLERVAALPTKPGVYIFRDAAGSVIYVGKALSLRNRLRSYFGSPRAMEAKTRALSATIADFDYIVTNTDQEALHLEATLVNRHQPIFNVRLKDDKHYPYLRIDVQNQYPRVEIARRVENDGARYFGPYASAFSVRRTMDVVKRLFPWRPCSGEVGSRNRPCLDFHIGRCIGPCSGECTQEEYDEVVRQVILFLEGRTENVLKALRRQMEESSRNTQYERAAILRDQIRGIEHVSETQVTAYARPTDEDVFGLARSDGDAVAQVLFIRGTKMIGGDSFPLDGTKGESDSEVMGGFLKQFYESATYVPRSILLPVEVPEHDEIEQWLSERRGGRVRLSMPQRGKKRALITMAMDNAREAVEVARLKWLTDTGKTQRALDELQEELKLPSLPKRIECYDISNIMGTSPVGSMVVFVDGKPRRAEYRRFRIKTVASANDVAMMTEVLRRRFKRAAEAVAGQSPESEGWAALPDLLIVDGGRPQLNAALAVLRESEAPFIPTAGLAKQEEELYVKDADEPIVLPRTSQALYLLQRIRDEAHRFAVTYHRRVRQQEGTRSALDAIPGIGPKRKRALLRKFGSVKEIRQAEVDDIAATVGFTRSLAERVKEYL